MRIFLIFREIVRLLSGKHLDRFPMTRKIFRFLCQRLSPRGLILTEAEGHSMYIRLGDGWDMSTLLLYGGTHYGGRTRTELFKKEVKLGMTVVDLGAHVGYFSLLAAKLVGEKGRVFAFEPAPDNYTLLTKNIAINGYKNVIPIQKAVSNESGQIRLLLADDSSQHTILPSSQTAEFVIVDSITLDEFFKDKDCKIDVIKMDIEGAEMSALEGMANIIKENENLRIFTEFHPLLLQRSACSPASFLNKLIEYGFKVHLINNEEKTIEPTSTDAIMELVQGETHKNGIDLFCEKG